MITKTIVTGIIAVLFLVFAIVFLMGKGDKLIAGYNTASEEELQGRRFAFQEEITIGRGAENDIRIPENFVSHRHATIFLHGAQYVIEDLGSVNHTYVNGQPLEGRAYLKPGDEIRVGMVTLRFER